MKLIRRYAALALCCVVFPLVAIASLGAFIAEAVDDDAVNDFAKLLDKLG